MKKLLLILLSVTIFSNIVFAETIYKYDKYGKKIGSYKTNQSNGTTTIYDKYGKKTGSLKTNSSDLTIQYDKYGKKVGSYK